MGEISPDMLAKHATTGEKLLPAALDEDVAMPKQEKNGEDEPKGGDGRIFAEAVLACSIKNAEARIMCSG